MLFYVFSKQSDIYIYIYRIDRTHNLGTTESHEQTTVSHDLYTSSGLPTFTQGPVCVVDCGKVVSHSCVLQNYLQVSVDTSV